MAHKSEVAVEKLSWRCDPSYLTFTCTAEMTPLEDFIGQERAIRDPIRPGVNKPGSIFCYRDYRNRQDQHHQTFLKKATAERAPVVDAESPATALCVKLYRSGSAAVHQDAPRLGKVLKPTWNS